MYKDKLWLNLLGLAGLIVLALWLSSCAPGEDLPSVGKERQPGPPEEARQVYDVLADTKGLSYDTTNEKTFSADVLGTRLYEEGPEGDDYVELVCAVDGRRYAVTLGPTWYLNRIGLKLAKNESVKITASGVATDGEEIIFARKVGLGGKTYELRDRWGAPLWRGKRPVSYFYTPARYRLAPSEPAPTKKKEPVPEWEGELMKEKWHERGEMMKKKWAEGHPQ